MSEQTPPPQLSPTTALATDQGLRASTETWFEYPIRVQPHHTDYEGVAWHGTYLTWMEEARVECLRSMGINYADLVKIGCVLPVVELSLRYHRPLKLGEQAIVKTRMDEIAGVRIHWDYKIQSSDDQQLYLTGRVTLVAIDSEKGKVMRQLPPAVKEALMKLSR
ncbi:acyl-CoA thioesterase [Gloeothece verrucosa]|uniref:Thioesterase superfamily protein n=1 Tax=Gloeothece verrucosa (strain PCC 7822) TaxID=497965 RepID=E0UK62_GLOV7|nr:thioesterase family protein [Gloeothece verrucosa]ADN15824.1 thioesterase superfamily protein [Gloeothece verrucosa PCC 7822]